MKKIFISFLFMGLFILSACAMRPNGNSDYYYNTGDEYLEINEGDFVFTSADAVSTFSLDTSTAGYANIRRKINNGSIIDKDMVKIEEMINYFNYDYPAPTNGDLAVYSEIMDCPWNIEHKLVSIGVKAKEVESGNIKNNIVFLLDTSGSMSSSDKIGLMQESFKLFVDSLDENDTISIVTYAGDSQVLLNGANGSQKNLIVNIIEDLSAGGSTAGAQGIHTAYNIAQEHFISDGNNRVILATDGDFNVGISSLSDLEDFIIAKRQTKVYLSLMGFGQGNLQDDTMETLANAGNGNYTYIDSISEAKKVLIEEMGGTLNVVANDTKTQVTFNPKYIYQYRLIGYENKLLTDDEFNNDETDAGEIGAGHVTTAVYELVLSDNDEATSTLGTDWMKVVIRYKNPTNQEITHLINETKQLTNPSEDLLFISGIVEMGLLLRNSPYKGNSSYSNIISRIENLDSVSTDPYKKEFLQLVKLLD